MKTQFIYKILFYIRYLTEEWTQMEQELLRERGLWGPIVGSRLDKWMLDMTEGKRYTKVGDTHT